MPEISFHPTLATWSANREGRTTIVKPIYRPMTQTGINQNSHSSLNFRPPPVRHNSWSNALSSAKESQNRRRRGLGEGDIGQSPLIDARGLITRGSNLSRKKNSLLEKEYSYSIPVLNKGQYPPDRTLAMGEPLFHSTKALHSAGGNGIQAKAVAYVFLKSI